MTEHILPKSEDGMILDLLGALADNDLPACRNILDAMAMPHDTYLMFGYQLPSPTRKDSTWPTNRPK